MNLINENSVAASLIKATQKGNNIFPTYNMFNFIKDCNKYLGDEPDMLFDDVALMCVPSRNSDRYVFRFEESFLGQLIALFILAATFDHFLPMVRTTFERFYEKQKFYSAEHMETKGYFGPLKTELKYDSGSALHHVIAGLLMTAGWALNGQTLLFRLGILTEVSIEVLDIRDMIYSKGLWSKSNKLDMEAYAVTLAHHLPGIGLILPLNLWCSCVDTWQRIAIAMELVGGVLLIANVLRKILKNTPYHHLVLDVFSLLCWTYARFYVATPLMIDLIKTGLVYKCKATYALIIGSSIMTIFNMMIVIDFFLKINASLHLIFLDYVKMS